MDIPLDQLQSVMIESDHESGSFRLMNGDKLKGMLDGVMIFDRALSEKEVGLIYDAKM